MIHLIQVLQGKGKTDAVGKIYSQQQTHTHAGEKEEFDH